MAKGLTAAQLEAHRKMQEALRNAAELKQMLSSLEKVDDEGRRNSLLDSVCSKEDILSLPVHPNPPGIKNGNLVVDLLKHQVGTSVRHLCQAIYLYLSQIHFRAKLCNGVSNMNIPNYPRPRQIVLFNSGN